MRRSASPSEASTFPQYWKNRSRISSIVMDLPWPVRVLRAATRLARLKIAAGDPEAAADTLRPIYDTFTEGFATADVIAARRVLATLGGS